MATNTPEICIMCSSAWNSISGRFCSEVGRFITQDGIMAVPACERLKLDMDNREIKALKGDILSWYWGNNSPSPMLAFGVMMVFIAEAKRKKCTENGEELRRGEYMFVAKDFCAKYNIPMRTFRTICDKTCAHNLTLKRHSTNKKATIITICNFNDYEPTSRAVRQQIDTNPTTNRQQTDTTATNNICTRDKNINNKENNINFNNFSQEPSAGARARVRRREGTPTDADDRPPLYKEIAEASKDTAWLQALADSYHVSIESIVAMFGPFRNECLNSGKIAHKDITDCKKHFHNWLRIQLKSNGGKHEEKTLRMPIILEAAAQSTPTWKSNAEYEEACQRWAKDNAAARNIQTKQKL